eukprot:g3781.t1
MTDPQAAAQRPTAKPALEFNHEYVLGEPETTDCPAGGQPVESADECGVAAKKLGKMYLGEQNPAEMDPKGCQFRIPDQDIYFNPHPTGRSGRSRSLTIKPEKRGERRSSGKGTAHGNVGGSG